MRYFVAAILLPPLLTLAPAAAGAAGTCQGQPATIESSGGPVTGTSGDDVILVTGRADVDAREGSDLVCVVDGTVVAGPGDDSVQVTGAENQTFALRADLGPGDDRYSSSGGFGYDAVDVGGDSTGRDTISTGEGHDAVSSGVLGHPNLDVIDLGRQGGSLSVVLPPGSNVQASGATPEDTTSAFLTVIAEREDPARWSVRLPGQFSRAGAALGTFTGFHSTRLEFGPATPVTVRGSKGIDRLSLEGGVPDVDLGAGKDFLSFDGLPSRGRVDGGTGRRNWLSVASAERLEVDSQGGALGSLKMKRFQVFALGAPTIAFRGSKHPETVFAVGCAVALRGGGGSDWLSRASEDSRPSLPPCATYRFRMYGGPGDDRLNGWQDRDKLIGGRGRDLASGHGGRDVCRAETERGCER